VIAAKGLVHEYKAVVPRAVSRVRGRDSAAARYRCNRSEGGFARLRAAATAGTPRPASATWMSPLGPVDAGGVCDAEHGGDHSAEQGRATPISSQIGRCCRPGTTSRPRPPMN